MRETFTSGLPFTVIVKGLPFSASWMRRSRFLSASWMSTFFIRATCQTSAAFVENRHSPVSWMQDIRPAARLTCDFRSAQHGLVALSRDGKRLHLAVPHRVPEVDDQAHKQPGDHDDPRNPLQARHEKERGEDAEDRNQGNQRRFEGPLHPGMAHAQYPHACADDGEG